MDIEKIKELIALAREEGLSELEIRDGDETIRVAFPAGHATVSQIGEGPSPSQTSQPAAASKDLPSSAIAIESPMAGTFYRSAAPGEPPFIQQGQRIEIGDTLCIIESMKMMNEIKSERIGTVIEIPVDNGLAIEAGTPIFWIS